MNTLEQLKELEKKATPLPWNENTALSWNRDFKLIFEMRNVLPKLLAVVEAGDVLASYLDQFIQTAKVPEVRYEDALQLLIKWDAARKALG